MRYVLLLLALSGPAWAGDPWTREDTNWQIAYTVILALDCAQTRYGASHPEKFEEGNPLLGKYPSKGKIANICLATGLGHWGISYILPSSTGSREIGFRRAWQAGTTFIEGVVVLENFSRGSKLDLGIRVPF